MNPSALPARLAPQRTLQRGLEGVQNDFGFWLSNRVLIPMPSYDLGLGWEVPAGCERALGRGAFVTAMVRTWSTTASRTTGWPIASGAPAPSPTLFRGRASAMRGGQVAHGCQPSIGSIRCHPVGPGSLSNW
jgi:hypothetical protein